MKIILTGSYGLLGKYLLKTQPRNTAPEGIVDFTHHVIPTYRNNVVEGGIRLDVGNFTDVVEKLFPIQPDVIIHCAANGDVDSVENNPADAIKSDLLGVVNLVKFCEGMGCKFINLSSNAVYDGSSPPYFENDKRNPVNFYGKTKAMADDIVENSSCLWNIVRVIFLYGWPNENGRDNWSTKIIKRLKIGQELSLVEDSYTQPTYAEDVAKVIWKLVEGSHWKESWNLAGEHKMSIYDFGLAVCNVFELDPKLLSRAKLSQFKTIAPRPIDTCFGFDLPKKIITKLPGVVDGLKRMKYDS